MSNVKYRTIEIDGAFFNEGFCIYLMELLMELKDNVKEHTFLYVGMTGDNYYPSARSAFHRLSGHFDRAERSTQNQLGKHIGERNSYAGIKLKMHYFPIEGFIPIEGASNKKGDKDYFLQPKFAEPYRKYKDTQSRVAKLEKHIIFKLRSHFKGVEPSPLVNQTKGAEWKHVDKKYQGIVDKVMDIASQ